MDIGWIIRFLVGEHEIQRFLDRAPRVLGRVLWILVQTNDVPLSRKGAVETSCFALRLCTVQSCFRGRGSRSMTALD